MFREIPLSEISVSPFTVFDRNWAALTAGTQEAGYNTMTVSWGQLGTVWDDANGALPVAVCYVRPQRYTKQFMDREELFTLSWFGADKKKALALIGTKSGRDCDKVAEAGLTPVFSDGTAYFAEAELVLVCRKIYRAPLTEDRFTDPAIVEATYPKRDFHDVYVGQVLKALKKD